MCFLHTLIVSVIAKCFGQFYLKLQIGLFEIGGKIEGEGNLSMANTNKVYERIRFKRMQKSPNYYCNSPTYLYWNLVPSYLTCLDP